jgi:membrane-bound lytic murein transglycosylase F
MTASVPLRVCGRLFYRIVLAPGPVTLLVRDRSWLAPAVVALLAIAGCAPAPDLSLRHVRERGVLRVGSTFGPMTYYLGAEGPEGLDYELARDFAASLGLELQVTAYPGTAGLRAALRDGKADLVAANLTTDASWTSDALATKPCYEMPQVVVAIRGRDRPRELTDLKGKSVLVHDGSPQQRRAAEIKRQITDLTIVDVGQGPDGDLFDRLLAGEGDVALVDAAEFAVARVRHRRLVDAFADQPRPVQWLVAKSSRAIANAVDNYCAKVGGPSVLARAMQKTLPAARKSQRVPAAEFRALSETRLPLLLPFFLQAADATGLDWRLLAALGYQESQWDPTAISPNGAQGLMMLMPATARSLGVTDSLDPQQSIDAGARYLVEQRARLPARIREPDRTWFTLAIYNMGFGHLEDARVLTQMNGGNADVWEDVRRHMLLLEQEYWYTKVPNGYARGGETIGLVENVRQYLALLANYEPPPMPPEMLDEPEPEAPSGAPASAGSTPAAPPLPPANVAP